MEESSGGTRRGLDREARSLFAAPHVSNGAPGPSGEPPSGPSRKPEMSGGFGIGMADNFLASCTWCQRSRVVTYREWMSPRSSTKQSGVVCDHCFNGGADDGCRTCKERARRAAAPSGERASGSGPVGRSRARDRVTGFRPDGSAVAISFCRLGRGGACRHGVFGGIHA